MLRSTIDSVACTALRYKLVCTNMDISRRCSMFICFDFESTFTYKRTHQNNQNGKTKNTYCGIDAIALVN